VRAVMVLVFVAALSACGSTPEPPTFPEITFKHLHPIEIDAAEVEVVDAYTPPLRAPNVEHEFPTSPGEAVHRWARDRLNPVGDGGTVEVTIEDASVIEVPLERTTGVEGLVTVDQAFRYEARLEVAIELLDAQGRSLGVVRTTAERTRTTPEDLTLNERDQVFFELTEALMRDFNVEAEKALRRYLGEYVG